MIWTAQEAQAIDRLSSEAYGIPSLSLMNEAGQAIYRLALSLWKPYARFVVLAGGGGNGGDALVVARLLRLAGFDSSVFDVSGGKESPDRKAQRLAFEALGGRLLPFADGRDFQDLHGDLILIDGLTGLGLKGPLRPGLIASCLRAAGELRARDVLAIDLPSGMNADLWEQAAPNLAASHTMTFGALKPLHVGNPARKYCGVIHRAEIGFAPEAVNQVLAERSLSLDHYLRVERIPKLWEHLAADAHKFDRGHVLAIGGSPGKVGALLLAAEAAWQSGAGWVSVAPLSELLAPAWPREFTYESFALEGEIDETALVTFIRNRKVKGVLIGPGTMSSPLTPTLLRSLAELQKDSGLRLIFDAGALDGWMNLAAGISFDPRNTLLTPHPGEWKRLRKSMQELRGIEDLEAARQEFPTCSVIYKSSTPIVLSPDRASFLTLGDNSLAKAGSGDRLAGTVLGLSSTPRALGELAALAQNLLATEAREKTQD